MRRSLAFVAVLLGASPVAAEPCPSFGLAPKVVRASVVVTNDGGVVVAELPQATVDGGQPDQADWKLRAHNKLVKPQIDPIAPGLVVYRPPVGAAAFTLEDTTMGSLLGKARLATKALGLLAAPRVKAVVSGTTRTKHATTFVTVELDGSAPADAIALVVRAAKGDPLSFGLVGPRATKVSVYSTQGGCVTAFPNGTVIAQPGDRVVAFWVDASGRRSATTAPLVVTKPR
ncbi:MAG: hypothetical protein H6Q90_3846 [Deltaproteobacteria bacterium]|nr:hypothetical protein [Deltaproteobacteria bacterium]